MEAIGHNTSGPAGRPGAACPTNCSPTTVPSFQTTRPAPAIAPSRTSRASRREARSTLSGRSLIGGEQNGSVSQSGPRDPQWQVLDSRNEVRAQPFDRSVQADACEARKQFLEQRPDLDSG